MSNSSSASPTLDKSWSPALNSSGASATSGGMTLYDVISDDPFSGMTFVSTLFFIFIFLQTDHNSKED
jgi:hypothetical protein